MSVPSIITTRHSGASVGSCQVNCSVCFILLFMPVKEKRYFTVGFWQLCSVYPNGLRMNSRILPRYPIVAPQRWHCHGWGVSYIINQLLYSLNHLVPVTLKAMAPGLGHHGGLGERKRPEHLVTAELLVILGYKQVD